MPPKVFIQQCNASHIPSIFLVGELLSHVAHCSWHHIYAFVRIMDCLIHSPNGPPLLIYYPNEATAINIPFWRTEANFWNVESQPILVIKIFNDFILPSAKDHHWNYCVWKKRNNFMIEVIMGWFFVLNKKLITNNINKHFMKYKNIIGNNPLHLCVIFDNYFVDKHRINKKLHLLMFCLYIVKGWRDSHINNIWNL